MYKIHTIKGDVVVDRDFTGIIHVSNSEKQYWENGELHRTDGPAIMTAAGDKFYYQHFKLHRDNGPAIDSDGARYWFVHGVQHRSDGPAVDLPGGYREYWLNGVKYTRESYKRATGFDSDNAV